MKTPSTIYLEALAALDEKEVLNESNYEFWTTFVSAVLPPPCLTAIAELLTQLKHFDSLAFYNQHALNLGTSFKPIETEDLGRNYPVYFGIKHILNLTAKYVWPKDLTKNTISQFVSFVYENTAPNDVNFEHEQYYRDVYSSRDAMIMKTAKKNGGFWNVNKGTRKNLAEKIERYNEISSNKRQLGTKLFNSKKTVPSLWETSPAFEAGKYLTRRQNDGPSEYPDKIDRLNNRFGLLNPSEQQMTSASTVRNFARENVRSLSDPNQLSKNTIEAYLDYVLIDRGDFKLYFLALIAIATGITSRRLKELVVSERLATYQQVCLSPREAKIMYRYSLYKDGGHAREDRTKETLIELELASSLWSLILSEFANDDVSVDDAYAVRAFGKKQPGPSPTLNRLGNSSNLLYRRQFGNVIETMFLAGTIPVERRASASYLALDTTRLKLIFNQVLVSVVRRQLERLHKKTNENEAVIVLLNSFTQETESIITKLQYKGGIPRMIGSLLAQESPFNFVSAYSEHEASIKANIGESHSPELDSLIDHQNNLEVLFFFLLQIVFCARPLGPRTEIIEARGHYVVADKDSRKFHEGRYFPPMSQLSNALEKLMLSRLELKQKAKLSGLHIDVLRLDNVRPSIWLQTSSTLKANTLNSAKAHQFAAENWSYTPKQNNQIRHQCATLIYEEFGIEAVDQIMGHQIDGVSPSNQYATASDLLDTDVRLARDLLCRKFGFSQWEDV